MFEFIQLMIFGVTLSVLLFVIGLIISEDFRRFAARQTQRLVKMGLIILITVAVAAAYVISPIDIIPDFIPAFGQLDDILVALLSIGIIVLTILYNVGIISFDITTIGGSKKKCRFMKKPDEIGRDK